MRSRVCLTFCYGLFGVALQTLLFRDYLTLVESRDAGIAVFFAAWFIWVAAGTFVFRKTHAAASDRAGLVELLLVGLIPAFGLPHGLAVLCPGLAGVEFRPHLTIPYTLGWALLITAPVGLLTGLHFPILCRQMRDRDKLPVSLVYMLEAMGGVAGGLGVTVLLYQRVNGTAVFLIASAIASSSALWSSFAPSKRGTSWTGRGLIAACLGIVLAALATHADAALTKVAERVAWNRLVPAGRYRGSFSTAQADYLYGTDQSRWTVVRQGRVYETVGDQTQAGRIAAMALCQNFTAERVLVVGDGLSLCRSFLQLPRIKAVDWLDPDPQYVQSLLARLPESLQVSDSRLHCPAEDARTVLASSPQTYDIVIVNLPQMVSASLSRFTSMEFLEQVKRSMRPLGLVVLGITADEAVPGRKPVYRDAWARSTLNSLFAQTIVLPAAGRTFFLSADASYLQVSPVVLQTRFALLENASDILPPDSLSSVYRPDLALQVLDSYDAVNLPESILANSEARPSHYLCHLLQGAERSGLSFIKPAQAILRGGLPLVLVCISLLVLVRCIYVVRTAPGAGRAFDPASSSIVQHDTLLVIACSGLAGLGTFIALLYYCQSRYGSLYLHVGLVSALFALGLAVGVGGVRWTVAFVRPRGLACLRPVLYALVALVGIHAAWLAVSGFAIERASTWLIPAGAVVVSGFFCGGILALGVQTLESCGLSAESAAGRLMAADRLGGAAGSILMGLGLIPLFGFQTTLYVAAGLMLAGAVVAGALPYSLRRPARRVIPHAVLTPVGYGLFGLALCIGVGSHILAHAERSRAKSQDTTAVQDWVKDRRLSTKTVVLAPAAKEVRYHEVREGLRLKGYVFRSEDFSQVVYGYGGPMSVIMFTDPNGVLTDFRITYSRETPRYLSRIRTWMESLKGNRLFNPAPLQGVNSVTGATLSCDAVLRLLRNSGRRFAASVLAQGEASQAARQSWIERIDMSLAYWAVGLAMAIGAIYHGRVWSRLAVLAYSAVVGGFWLNRQYSTDHVFRLLSGDGLLAGPLAVGCLLLGVPLMVLLLGNVYCGYLCPFGALQELVSLIVPKRFKARLSLTMITQGRFIKYAVLAVLVIVFFTTGSKRVLDGDPLTLFFGGRLWSEGFRGSPGLIIAGLVLAGTLVVTRVWCRYLCPTGAFLSLFNLGGWLKRFLPPKKFGRCEFGLGGRDHLDCIYCDRCRYDSPLLPTREDVITKTVPNAGSHLFVTILLCAAALTWLPVFRGMPAVLPPSGPAEAGRPSEVRSSPEVTDQTRTFRDEENSGRRSRYRGQRDRLAPER